MNCVELASSWTPRSDAGVGIPDTEYVTLVDWVDMIFRLAIAICTALMTVTEPLSSPAEVSTRAANELGTKFCGLTPTRTAELVKYTPGTETVPLSVVM